MDRKHMQTSGKSHEHKDCHHQSLAKEFVQGQPTGDYICAYCGRSLSVILRAERR